MKYVNIFLLLGILASAGLAGYAKLRSVLYPTGTMWKYYALAVATIVFLLWALRWPALRKQKLVLLAVSSILSLYTGEVGLTILKPLLGNEDDLSNTMMAAAYRAGVPFDRRSRFELLQDLREEGVDAVPAISGTYFLASDGIDTNSGRLFPLANIGKRVVILCNESGEWTVYQSDEKGFNNPIGLHRTGAIDTVLIGDSFAEGACVKREESIGGQLRSLSFRALSLGIQGTGPLLQLAILREYARPLRPKNVVWLYWEGNDLRNLADELSSSLLTKYLEPEFRQGLPERQDAVNASLANFVEEKIVETEGKLQSLSELGDSRLVKFATLSRMRQLIGVNAIGRTDIQAVYPSPDPLLGTILDLARTEVEAWGGRLMIVYLPSWDRFSGSDRRIDPALFYREDVLGLIAAARIRLIDAKPIFASHADPLSLFPFRQRAHLNPIGYRLIADEIAAAILESDGVGSAVLED